MKKRLLSLVLIGCVFAGIIPTDILAKDIQQNMIEEGEMRNPQVEDIDEDSEEETKQEDYEENPEGLEENVKSDSPDVTVEEKGEGAEKNEKSAALEAATEAERAKGSDSNEVEELYNGERANYDDPEFVNLLERDFFEKGQQKKAKASYGAIHDERFEGYLIEDGIDVSKWNGDINWGTVAKTQDFVFIRAGYRGTDTGKLMTDSTFTTNMKKAVASGMQVGVYFFSQAVTTAEARQEAQYVLDLVKGYSFDLPIVFDYEFSAGGRLDTANLSKSKHTNNCVAFCEEIEEAGYSPMLYSNYDMLTNHVDGNKITGRGYEIWFARYNSYAGYSGEYTYWQYSSEGKVNGISGNTDLNYHYVLPNVKLDQPELTEISNVSDGIKVSWNKVTGANGYRVYRKQLGSGWETVVAKTTETNFTDESVKSGNHYIYTVRAYRGNYVIASENKYLDTYWSTYDSVGLNLLYLETAKLKSIDNRENGLIVQWDRVEGAEGYYVYRKKDNGSWTIIDTTENLEYIDTNVEEGKTYCYTVRAYAGDIRGYYETDGISTMRLPTSKIKILENVEDGITIKWNKIEGAEGYYVYRKEEGESYTRIAVIKDSQEISYTDTDIKENYGITYEYAIRAYRGSAKGYYVGSSILRFVEIGVPKLRSVTNEKGSMVVSWKEVPGADGYRVYRKTKDTGWSTVKTKTTGTSYTDKSVESGTVYSYTVRAYRGDYNIATDNKYEESYWSNYDTSGISSIYLGNVELISAENSVEGVAVKWNKVTGAEGYRVYRKVPGSSWSLIATTEDTEYVDVEELKGGETYLYTVRAYSGDIKGYYDTKGVSVVKLAATSITALKNREAGVTIYWDEIAGAEGYYVYRKEEGESYTRIAEIKDAAKTNYTDESIRNENGIKYIYAVRAYVNSTRGYYESMETIRLQSNNILRVESIESESVNVEWSRNSAATAYQIYCKSENDKKMITTEDTSALKGRVSGLKKGDTYSIYVRSVKIDSEKEYYSGWSVAKTVKIK